MTRMNCWEFQECGRERGGKKANELGTCPAATQFKLNGLMMVKMQVAPAGL